jgi:peptidyl-prolyl cis-trans isomerase A (cyclophilin A)
MHPVKLALAGRLIVAALVGIATPPDKPSLTKPALFTERAPAVFKAKFETSKGDFVVTVHRAWAPLGADRFFNLVKSGYYDDCRFFRVIDSVMAQVGINGNPEVQSAWDAARIKDDPINGSNKRGFVSFATAGADTRATQFFVNLKNNTSFDRLGSAPLGEVTSGMEVVDSLYSGYGEGAPRGRGPDQSAIRMEGNAYLTRNFPKLDFVKRATIEK